MGTREPELVGGLVARVARLTVTHRLNRKFRGFNFRGIGPFYLFTECMHAILNSRF